ncbi:GDP-mannose 4,6-dehydratase [Nocardioides sp. CCNWLW239]|uniref:GDP-mannose 4,6-dehydratase n=1 Tax=Nocardioides sp. CCNWLW239 TaxID=3128902 RepID=UPI0030181907
MSSGQSHDPPPLPVAFVTGATGQDGSYLCERLLADGVEVHALSHQASNPGTPLGAWQSQVHWHDGDLGRLDLLRDLLLEVSPSEVYNLGGISSVAYSWDEPIETAQVTGLGAASLFDAAWRLQESTGSAVRVVQASSAEIFGSPEVSPQNEDTPVRPVSPYGAAKAFAHHLASTYRARGLGVSALVLYNHESPRRPASFVTRKITRGAAAISLGHQSELALGNLDSVRDWGWAPDFVDAMVRANRAAVADDYVIATGQGHSVRDFVAAAFDAVGIDDWERRVRIDPAFFRPSDPAALVGDASKARSVLGWRPTMTFEAMVAAMVDQDVDDLTDHRPGQR